MPADGEMPERLRRFLLLPGPGGEEAERLGSPSAFYLGILVVPPEDRHSLALVLLELLALVSGLFVSVPQGVGSGGSRCDSEIPPRAPQGQGP